MLELLRYHIFRCLTVPTNEFISASPFDIVDIACYFFELIDTLINFLLGLYHSLVEIIKVIFGVGVSPHSFRHLYQGIAHQEHEKDHSPDRCQAFKESNEAHLTACVEKDEDNEKDHCANDHCQVKDAVRSEASLQAILTLEVSCILPFLQNRYYGPSQRINRPIQDKILQPQLPIDLHISLPHQSLINILWHQQCQPKIEDPSHNGPYFHLQGDILTRVVVDQIDADSRQQPILYDFVDHQFICMIGLLLLSNQLMNIAALVKLVKKGDCNKLREVIHSENVNVNEIDAKSGKALLHMAIENGDVDIFNVLAQAPGVNLEELTKEGEHPLEMAVRLNDVVLVNRLLQLKVNIRKRNKEGETVIFTAIRNQTHKDIIKKLFQYFDVNEKVDFFGNYLNLSISSAQNDNFYFLIQEPGVKYLVKDDEDNTCLILAVKLNKGDYVVAILEKLEKDPLLTAIQKQFFFNSQNKEGNTALHEACIKGHQTITQRLETYGHRLGFDASLKNKKGQTIDFIKLNIQKSRISQLEMEKKRQEERVVRRKQKEEEKIRQRQEEERLRVEEKKRKKEQEERLEIETKVKNETQKQKTLWIAAIILIAALAIMYMVINNAIEQKKVPSFE